jgi:hypothetical protein
VALGPTSLLRAVFLAPTAGPTMPPRQLVAEMWLYQDGSRILELSTKCLPAEAFQVGTETRSYFVGLGIPISGGQQTKTRTALGFFRKELEAEAASKP